MRVFSNKASKQRFPLLVALMATSAACSAQAQQWSPPNTGNQMPTPSAPVSQPPVSIVQPQPPVVVIRIPIIPIRPDTPRTPTPINPRDLVATPISTGEQTTTPNVALKGVNPLQDSKFPSFERVSGSFDWILVRPRDDSQFNRPNSYAVHLQSGQLLVSVRRPSKMALLTCDGVEIAAEADSDLLFTHENEVTRIVNLTGCHDSVKVKLKHLPEGATKSFTVKPGYELVYRADQKLVAHDLRVSDGFARRHLSVIENGHIAVAELSVESVMNNCDLIARLEQQGHGAKEKRIFSDMSKMAAVLNYVNGSAGYKTEPGPQVTLEVKSNVLTKKSDN